MYTVFIQPKRTLDKFQQFFPVFRDAVDAGRIGLCQWVETGKTLEAAVPELYSLVTHKRAWRAVVVCTEFDEPDTQYPAAAANPFDFLENQNRTGITVENGELVDCETPLIRLTHLLGGIPAPEPMFEATLLTSEDKVPTVAYHPVDNDITQVRKNAYEKWSEAHKFQGPPPTEIILLKVRRASVSSDAFAQVKAAWQVHTEADSSEFWKRNLYPHNCRFLVYDMDQRGVMRQQRDLFKLWVALLLVAENQIDPNVLQAHRLYRLDLLLDEKRLKESFQQTINRLNMAKYQLEKSIAKDEEDLSAVVPEIPDYTVGVPVSFQLDKKTDVPFSADDYGLTGGVDSDDLENWETYSAQARAELRTLLQSTDRTLDQAAKRLHEHCHYAEYQVLPLNQYQEEDFNASLDEVYQDILREQAALPAEMTEIRKRVTESHAAVRKAIQCRVSRSQAIYAIGLSVAALVLCLLPGFLSAKERLPLAAAIAFCVAATVAAAIVTLVVQRKRLIEEIREFRRNFQAVMSEISRNATAYSDFLSSVASHIRGRSYLDIMRQKRRKKDSSYYYKQKHLKSVEIFLEKMSLWSAALHAEVDMLSVDAIELMDEGHGEANYDILYTLSNGKHSIVPVNHTGGSIQSPFTFVERIEIEREEVYDDVESV